MNEAHKAHYNTAIIRLLPLLDAMHPDSRGTILIHGSSHDTETYAEIARSFDFKFERSETSEDFACRIASNPHFLLIMIIADEICYTMRSSLMHVCRKRDPIYVLHITTREGDVPNTDRKDISFIHHKDVSPEDAVVAQKMWATLELIKQANEDITSREPVPDYLANS